MVDPRGNSPKEIDLETLFAESFSALPPDEVVEKVNPFRRAVNRVLIGMALCTLTLNFWGLNYILPTVGMVLSLLGFRALRRENGCFTACFVLTLLRCVQFFPRSSLWRSCWAYSSCGWGCGRCSGRRTCRPRRAGSWRCWCGMRSCMYWR